MSRRIASTKLIPIADRLGSQALGSHLTMLTAVPLPGLDRIANSSISLRQPGIPAAGAVPASEPSRSLMRALREWVILGDLRLRPRRAEWVPEGLRGGDEVVAGHIPLFPAKAGPQAFSARPTAWREGKDCPRTSRTGADLSQLYAAAFVFFVSFVDKKFFGPAFAGENA